MSYIFPNDWLWSPIRVYVMKRGMEFDWGQIYHSPMERRSNLQHKMESTFWHDRYAHKSVKGCTSGWESDIFELCTRWKCKFEKQWGPIYIMDNKTWNTSIQRTNNSCNYWSSYFQKSRGSMKKKGRMAVSVLCSFKGSFCRFIEWFNPMGFRLQGPFFISKDST